MSIFGGRGTALLVGLIVFAAVVGCQTGNLSKKGMLEQSVEENRITSRQLRLLLNDYVFTFTGNVEEAADRIIEASEDHQIKRNALMWKVYATTACYRSAMLEDPLAAYYDLHVLTLQMITFFEAGPGRDVFGNHQSIAVAASRKLGEDMTSVVQAMSLNPEAISKIRNNVISEAQGAQIETLYFVRPSIMHHYVELTNATPVDLVGLAEDLHGTVKAMGDLLNLYANQLPSLSRWEAQLLFMDLAGAAFMEKALLDFSKVTHSIDRITKATEQLPELVDTQREEAFERIESERKVILAELERMRLETLADAERMRAESFAQIEKERVAAMGDAESIRSASFVALAKEREMLLLAISAEREAMMAQLSREREAATADVQVITKQTSEAVDAKARALIDHFFYRALQLCGVLVAVAILGAFLVTIMLRRR